MSSRTELTDFIADSLESEPLASKLFASFWRHANIGVDYSPEMLSSKMRPTVIVPTEAAMQKLMMRLDHDLISVANLESDDDTTLDLTKLTFGESNFNLRPVKGRFKDIINGDIIEHNLYPQYFTDLVGDSKGFEIRTDNKNVPIAIYDADGGVTIRIVHVEDGYVVNDTEENGDERAIRWRFIFINGMLSLPGITSNIVTIL